MANGNTIGRLTYQPYPQGDSSSNLSRSKRETWTLREFGHNAIDVLAHAPAVGFIFDGANGAWYAAEGDYQNAALSFTSAGLSLVTGGISKSAITIGKAIGRGIKAASKAASKGAEAASSIEKSAAKSAEKAAAKDSEKAVGKGKGKDEGGGDTKSDEASDPCKKGNRVGHPINPVLGIKLLDGPEELDFSFPAMVPLIWQRAYYSDVGTLGFMGQGWLLPTDIQIHSYGDKLVFFDEQGRRIYFPQLRTNGQTCVNNFDSLTLTRISDALYFLTNNFSQKKYWFLLSYDINIFHLVLIEDRFGNKLSISRERDGRASQIIDSSGRCYFLDYVSMLIADEEQYRITQISCRFSSFSKEIEPLIYYKYDDEGNLIAVNNPDHFSLRTFDYKEHMLIKHVLYGGYECYYEYDEYNVNGRVIKHTTNSGEAWEFKYQSRETVVTDGLRRKKVYKYDEHYNLTELIDNNQNSKKYQYDKWNRRVKEIDEEGNTTKYRYDSMGNVILTRYPDGNQVRAVYDKTTNLPLSITSKDKGRYEYNFDMKDGHCTVRTPSGKTTRYLFDNHGKLLSILDPSGNKTDYKYSYFGQIYSITDCSGNKNHYKPDKYGRISHWKAPDGGVTQYHRNSKGQCISVKNPDGSVERYSYDVYGRLIRKTINEECKVIYDYHYSGLLKSIVTSGDMKTCFIYDSYQRMTKIINSAGQIYFFEWGDNDRVSSETDFYGYHIQHFYDRCGRVVENIEYGLHDGKPDKELKRNEIISYDSMGRIVSIENSFNDSTSRHLRNYYYDRAGRIIEAQSSDNIINIFRYDSDGLLTAETTKTELQDFTLNYSYDDNGNVIEIIMPNGRAIKHQYYGSSHLLSTYYADKLVCDYERDDKHRQISRTQGDLISHFEYDVMDRLVTYQVDKEYSVEEKSTDPLLRRYYTWNLNGTLHSLFEQSGPINGRTDFQYDILGRLTGSGRERYIFDSLGNVQGENIDTASLSSYSSGKFGYDSFGNINSKKETQQYYYTWNANNQLSESSLNGHVTQYGYDALGRRTYKRSKGEDKYFIWSGNQLVYEKSLESQYVFIYGDDEFTPVAQVKENNDFNCSEFEIYWFHTDISGLPVAVSNTHGNFVWQGKYSVWGKLLTYSGVGDIHQPFRFRGQYADSETGMSYNRFRYYEPLLAQYVSRDPIKLNGGLNFYQYVENPLIMGDPLGLARGITLVPPAAPGAPYELHLSLSQSDYPESFGHIADAINSGQPDTVTIDRNPPGVNRGPADRRRAQNMADFQRNVRNGVCPPAGPGEDRDEWPMAMFAEGGRGSSVRPIDAADNRGAGSAIASALRGLPNGTRVRFIVGP